MLPVVRCHGLQGIAGMEFDLISGCCLKMRTSHKTAVAAIEHVAHGLPCPFGQLSPILYSQIGKASTSVEG